MSESNAIVRLSIGNDWLIKQVLDADAQTILIPLVETDDQAKSLVDAYRYPPVGKRDVGSALARSSQFSGIPDYLTTADAQICFLVQVKMRADPRVY